MSKQIFLKPGDTLYFLYDQVKRQNDFLLATLQSSGTHWIRFIIARAIVKYYDLDYEFQNVHPYEVVPSFGVCAHRNFRYNSDVMIPRVQHTHQCYKIPHSFFFKRKRTILLVRDLRDALVSHYDKMRRGGTDLTFGQFLMNDQWMREKSMHGSLGGRVEFLNSWGRALQRLNGLVVYYETLKSDPYGEAKRVLEFMGINPTDALMEDVIAFSSLSNMKRIAQQAVTQGETDKHEQELRSINKGKVGKSRDVFGDKEMRFFREYIHRHLEFDFGYRY